MTLFSFFSDSCLSLVKPFKRLSIAFRAMSTGLILSALSVCGQNMIANGDFSNGVQSWDDLLSLGTGKATGSVVNGAYVIAIEKGGSEVWNVQLKQKGFQVVKGEGYTISFDAWAAAPRPIEAAVGMENGPYTFYSDSMQGRVQLDTAPKRFTFSFKMNYPTDPNARIQFNCGRYDMGVSIDNVELRKIDGKVLRVLRPNGDEIWPGGAPVTVTWFGVGVNSVNVQYSFDNGLHWSPVADDIPDSGKCQWIIPDAVSPWALVRVMDAEDGNRGDTSDGPFQVGSFANLVRNGTFSDGLDSWAPLGVYGGKAGAAAVGGECVVTVDTAGSQPWHVQFSQPGIALIKGRGYTYSFDAYADRDRGIDANIGMDGGAYTSYIDSSFRNVNLSTEKKNFTFSFTMTKTSDPRARIEFNLGMSPGVIHIDNVKITSYKPSGVRAYASCLPRGIGRAVNGIVDLAGRKLGLSYAGSGIVRMTARGYIRTAGDDRMRSASIQHVLTERKTGADR